MVDYLNSSYYMNQASYLCEVFIFSYMKDIAAIGVIHTQVHYMTLYCNSIHTNITKPAEKDVKSLTICCIAKKENTITT